MALVRSLPRLTVAPNIEGERVRLLDRLSDSPCTQGRSWGYNRHEIWVDNGCRAVFEVRW